VTPANHSTDTRERRTDREGHREFYSVCRCGWVSQMFAHRKDADNDGDGHVIAMARAAQ